MPYPRPTLTSGRLGRYARLAVIALGLGLIVLQLNPAAGRAECDPRDDACLEQEGDNDADVDIDAEGQGGDAIAGSQVITVQGGGDTRIEANNRSRFARAKGGDVEGEIETNIDNGPRIQLEQGSSSTNSIVGGVTQIDQNGEPRVSITLDQVSAPTGTIGLSNTAFATGFATGTNVVSQAPLGAGPVLQVIDQTMDAPVENEVMPDINVESDNISFVTGVAPVTQSATARVSPAALAFGGGSANAIATAVVPVVQEASPAVSLALDQVAAPTGVGLVSTSARSVVRLDSRNEATGTLGAVDQTTTQDGGSPVTNTVTPSINVTASNTATIVGSSPVDQQAIAIATPTATAIGGLGDNLTAALFQLGDNEQIVDVAFSLIGGDAIAGSNVIAVASTGDTTVAATNDSVFASAEGGDTTSVSNTTIDNGPVLAMGIGRGAGQAAMSASASPTMTGTAQQLGSVLTTVLTRTGVLTAP